MALDPASLGSALADIAADPPEDFAGCAAAWADAIGSYAGGVVPPSASVSVAQAALEVALVGAFASGAAAPLMEVAFVAFGVAIAGGMAPAFVGVPPSGPVGFAELFAGPKPETHAEGGQAVADLIDSWMTDGSATPALGGPSVPWS